MSADRTSPADVKLSELDVKRVLERAARIDADQPPVSLADLTRAAQEAGISERAVNQAVMELLDGRQLVPVADAAAARPDVRAASLWVRVAALGFVLAVSLLVIAMLGRLFISL